MRALKHASGGKAIFTLVLMLWYNLSIAQNYSFEFYGNTFNFELDESVNVKFSDTLNEKVLTAFYTSINKSKYQPIVDALISHKEKYHLNDWLYYQLIRKTAQQIAPKATNYYRYTLYKWFFLAKTGYDARLALEKDKILFYVLSDDDISDIPFYMSNGKQYVCLNIHDYENIDLKKNKIYPVDITIPEGKKPFSYKVTQMPEFKSEDYSVKNIEFNYKQRVYHFDVLMNSEIQGIFRNYPVVDFASYFNIPLSKQTYSSLIPNLKKNISKMSQRKGVDYLMRFTRNAFSFEDDEQDNA